MHPAAVGGRLRPGGARHSRHPLPRRLPPRRRQRADLGPPPAARADGHRPVRPRRQPRQDRGPSTGHVLPRHPARLGRTDRVMHRSARGRAHGAATLAPPSASHHKGACCITDRQALLRCTGPARGPSLHATHVGRPAPVQVQATLDTHPHRPRLPGRPALLGTAASSLERQTAMALNASGSIRLRLRRQPPRLRLLPRVRAYAARRYGRLRDPVRTYAARQYGRPHGVAPTPPGRGYIQRLIQP